MFGIHIRPESRWRDGRENRLLNEEQPGLALGPRGDRAALRKTCPLMPCVVGGRPGESLAAQAYMRRQGYCLSAQIKRRLLALLRLLLPWRWILQAQSSRACNICRLRWRRRRLAEKRKKAWLGEAVASTMDARKGACLDRTNRTRHAPLLDSGCYWSSTTQPAPRRTACPMAAHVATTPP